MDVFGELRAAVLPWVIRVADGDGVAWHEHGGRVCRYPSKRVARWVARRLQKPWAEVRDDDGRVRVAYGVRRRGTLSSLGQVGLSRAALRRVRVASRRQRG